MEEDSLVPPVSVGDILEKQDVISVGKKDDGVVKIDGYILFINDCKENQVIDFEVEKVLKNFGIGKLVKIHK